MSKFRKKSILPFIIVPVALVVTLFVANLAFGFVKFGDAGNKSGSHVNLPAITVWAVCVGDFDSKDGALRKAKTVRNMGGAGFVLEKENKWKVIEGVYKTHEIAEEVLQNLDTSIQENAHIREMKIESKNVAIKNSAHTTIFTNVINSFTQNFTILNDNLFKHKNGELGTNEVAQLALQKYNQLLEHVVALDGIVQTAYNHFYAELMLGAQRQLMTLYLLSTEKNSDNMQSHIKSTASNIIFAYLSLPR